MPLVDVLRAILRAVAIVDGLVCLYALIQACALTVQERRRTVAVLRACGAGARAVRRLLVGAVLALVVPAAVSGSCSSGSCSARRCRAWPRATRRCRSAPSSAEIAAVLAGLWRSPARRGRLGRAPGHARDASIAGLARAVSG